MVSIVDLGMVGDVGRAADGIDVELLPTFVGCPALELIREPSIARLASAAFGRPVAGRRDASRCRGRSRSDHAGRAWRPWPTAGIAPPTEPGDVALPVLRRRPGRDGQRCSARRSAARCSTAAPAASRSKPSSRSDRGVTSSRDVGIVGAGRMGAGIAQVALEAGHDVVLHDVDPAALERGVAAVQERARPPGGPPRPRPGLDRRLGRRPASPASPGDQPRRPSPAPTSSSRRRVEDLAVKRGIFRGARRRGARPTPSWRRTRARCPSPPSRSATGAAGARPRPALLQPGPGDGARRGRRRAADDGPEVADRAVALMAAWGKTPVRCADTPGFIVNRVNRPFTIEALRILEAGDGRRRGDRRRDARGGLPDGAVRADGPHRHRRQPRRRARRSGTASAVPIGSGRRRSRSGSWRSGRLGRKTGHGFYRLRGRGRGSRSRRSSSTVAGRSRRPTPSRRASTRRSTTRRVVAVAEGVATPRRHRPRPAPRRRASARPIRAGAGGGTAPHGYDRPMTRDREPTRPRGLDRRGRPHADRPLRRRARERPPGRSRRARAARGRRPRRRRPGARRGRHPRLRQPGRRGQPRRRPDGAAARRLPGRGRRPDRQPAVRVRAPGDQHRGARHRGRRRRRLHRRRRRVDDARAVRPAQGGRRPATAARASSPTRRSAGGS